MARTLQNAILLIAVTGGLGCDVNVLTTCEKDLSAVLAQGIAAGKIPLCKALTDYEVCFQTNSVGCPATQVQAFKNVVTASRQQLSGTMGVDCLKASASTEPPLASGDSGSRSGSEPVQSSLSSGSGSASMPWQIAFLVTLFICCCAAGIGGAVYAMTMKKKKGGAPKTRAPREDYENYEQPEAQPLTQEPIASVAVDVDGDGRADAIVTGVDANNDGIPDALQGDRTAAAVVQEVAQPIQEVVAAPVVTTYAGPVVTGPTTTSSYMPYGAYGAYPGTTSYAAAPVTTYPATTYPAGTTYTTGAYGGYTGATSAYATRIG